MSVTLPTGYSIPQSFHIQKDGYQGQTVGIQRGFRFPGVFPAFFPLFVDVLRGDFLCIANTSYHARMVPLQAGADGAGRK